MTEINYNMYWSNAFDNMEEFVSLIDSEYNLLRVNRSFSIFLNKSESDLIGKKCFEIFCGKDNPFQNYPHKNMLTTKVCERMEFIEPTLKRAFSVVVTPILSDDNNSIGSIHIIKDITELKNKEEEFKERNRILDSIKDSEEKYKKIMDGSNDCIYLLNNKGCLLEANRKALMLNEITDTKSFFGMPFIHLSTERYKEPISDCVKTVLSGEARQCYYETLSPSKRQRSWNAIFLPIKDVTGDVASILNISRDMTFEQESKVREAYFKEYANTILANLPISVLVVNRLWEITFANRNFFLKMRLNEQDVIGNSLKNILTTDVFARTNLIDQIETVLKTREVITGQRFDYRQRNFLYSLMPIKETDGRRHNVAVMMEDVTERMMLEEQLKHSEKLAMMGQFAAGVTHEINNPLSIIKGNVQYLREQIKRGVDFHKEESFRDLKDTLAAVEHETTRCAEIIGELLHFSKRTITKQKKRVDIKHLIRHVLHLMERRLSLRKIKVVRELTPDFLTLRGDQKLLQQVIMNLLINAEQAIGKRGGTITIKTLKDKQNVYIIVKDSGCGIPKEMQQFIFDPFFTTKGSGTGLGLSVVHSIVEDHGGTISVKSSPKQGSTFTVTLPIG